DGSALEHLHHRLRGHARELVDTLARQLDDEENVAAAAESVRRLMFLDKLRHEIDDAPEALDNGHMALLQIAEPGEAAEPHRHRLAAGIDLGTTNSLVATVRSGSAECLPGAQGAILLPSVVHYRADGGVDVGAEALAHASA